MVARDHADTAMLLRELASLGFGMDDEPPPPPKAPATPGAELRSAGRPEEEAQGPVRPRLIAPSRAGSMGRCEQWCSGSAKPACGSTARWSAACRQPGLCVLVGVTHDDTEDDAARLAAKVHELRILDGERSAAETGAPLLVISQFTLYGDTRKGRRPTWNAAAPGPVAEPLVQHVVTVLRDRGAHVETGRFGADMQVALVNDGPVTLLLEV